MFVPSIVRDVLATPVQLLVDPSKRVFAPFLLVAVLMSFAVMALRGIGVAKTARALSSRKLWLHRSSIADAQLIFAKALLRAMFVGSWGVSTLLVTALTAGWLRTHFVLNSQVNSAWLVGALFTLSAFVLEDFSRFITHWLMHRVPLLWAVHRVHHTAEVLTPFSLYRTHPIEAAINGARGAVAMGAVSGLFVWLAGPTLVGWQLLSVDALGLLWSLCGANLRHSHVWLSYGPIVERWLISPAQHQVHHSCAKRHSNRNFGTVFAFWDRLFATLYVTSTKPEHLHFGTADAPPHNALALLVEPLRYLVKRSGDSRRVLSTPRAWTRITTPAELMSLSTTATVAVMVGMCAGCTPATQNFDRVALLQSFGRCTADVYARFQSSTDALVIATAAYEATPNELTLRQARAAWVAAIDLWQQAELLRFGPAADNQSPGGQRMREQIYSWPTFNRCFVEAQLATRGYLPGVASLSPDVRGLAAVEFLLYSADASNICPPDHQINAMGLWSALDADELTRRRAAYAQRAAVDLASRARALALAWGLESSTGYRGQLSSAGRESTLFASQQNAFSAIAEGPFFLDIDSKDLRLGTPLGIVNCMDETCPTAVESPYADRGKQHLLNNLAGARSILLGCSAGAELGFDDLLDSAGGALLTTQLREKLAAATLAVEAIEGESLSAALANNPAQLRSAHTTLRELTMFLKTEFASTLRISAQRVEGDHD